MRHWFSNSKIIYVALICSLTLMLNIFIIKHDGADKICKLLRDREPDFPVFMVRPDGRVRHCITEVTLGNVSNMTEIENFTPIYTGATESPTGRIQSFKNVFQNRAWGKFSDEKEALSASGFGSTLPFVQEIMGVLHKIINDIKIMKGSNYVVKMLDIPCGDFAWMSRFLSNRDDVDYTGMDIVPELIEHHKKKYSNIRWNFINQDIAVAEKLDNYDIILCRMMLQHLLTRDAMRILSVFSNNSNGFLITTTFPKNPSNQDVNYATPHRFRRLNLEIPPISLVPPLCVSRDGPPDHLEEMIGVWKLPLKRVSKCISVKKFKVTLFNAEFHACLNWI